MTRKRARSPDWTSFGTRVTPSALKWWAEQGDFKPEVWKTACVDTGVGRSGRDLNRGERRE